jgi:hypothetical protein
MELAEEEPSKVYELTTALKDVNVGRFLSITSAVLLAENAVYYPFDLIRTRLQVDRDSAFTVGKTIKMIKELKPRGAFFSF